MTTAIPLPGSRSSVPAKLTELERARQDVAFFAALAEKYPTSARTAMVLDATRGWEGRVLAFLHSCGWSEEP
jgi:hypothetical protein